MREVQELAQCHNDKCGREFPANESMPHPETEKGDYCPECYCNLFADWEVKKHGAQLSAHFLPAWQTYYDSVHSKGKCHAASRVLTHHLNQVLPKGSGAKVQRGFCTAPTAQHSWVIVWHDDWQLIVDPTQFQFTKEPAGYAFADPEDERYDLCGWQLEQGIRGGPPIAVGKLQPWPWKSRALIAEAKRRLKCPPKQNGLTLDQAVWLCHRSAKYLSREFFAGLAKDFGAFIPMETKIYLGLMKDPDADVNTRKMP